MPVKLILLIKQKSLLIFANLNTGIEMVTCGTVPLFKQLKH